MCIPGLHVSLGVFYRLYSLLVGECHQLDLHFADNTGSLNLGGGVSYERYSSALRNLCSMEEEQQKQAHLVCVLEQLSTYAALTLDEGNPALETVRQETRNQKGVLKDMVKKSHQ